MEAVAEGGGWTRVVFGLIVALVSVHSLRQAGSLQSWLRQFLCRLYLFLFFVVSLAHFRRAASLLCPDSQLGAYQLIGTNELCLPLFFFFSTLVFNGYAAMIFVSVFAHKLHFSPCVNALMWLYIPGLVGSVYQVASVLYFVMAFKDSYSS